MPGNHSHDHAGSAPKPAQKGAKKAEEEEDCSDESCCDHEINFHDASCRMVYALKGNQKDIDVVTEAFEKELKELERKFEKMSQPFFQRRRAIIFGEQEPTEKEIQAGKASIELELTKLAKQGNTNEAAPASSSKIEEIPSSEDEAENKTNRKGVGAKKQSNNKEEASSGSAAPVEASAAGTSTSSAKKGGIPNFWFHVLQRRFEDQISERDSEILKYVTDIQCASIEDDPFLGYTLSFHFAENPYFNHRVLTKTYHLEREFNESVLVRTEGFKINWNARSMDPTVEIKKKTQKNKTKKTTRVVDKEVKVDSFFDFFDPPQIPQDDDEGDDEEDEEEDYEALEERIEYDYEMGNTLKDDVIPMAVDTYLGIAQVKERIWMFPGGAQALAQSAGLAGLTQLQNGQATPECKQQ